MYRVLSPLLAGGLLLLLTTLSPATHAASLSGVVQLPEGFEAPPRFAAPGYWQGLRNEVLEILPPLLDPRREMVVALVGAKLTSRQPDNAVVRLVDMRFAPVVLPVHPGTRVVFRNEDPAYHLLEPAEGKFLSPMRLGSGEQGSHSFENVGRFKLRSAEHPHMLGEVVVLSAPRFTVTDAAGAFAFEDLPEGTYTLRVWFRGQWIHSEKVTVDRRNNAVKVKLPAQDNAPGKTQTKTQTNTRAQ